jgi:hypothetical protein
MRLFMVVPMTSSAAVFDFGSGDTTILPTSTFSYTWLLPHLHGVLSLGMQLAALQTK